METLYIASKLKLSPRGYSLSFAINSSLILIAGGYDESKEKKDCYMLDLTHNTLIRTSDLPEGDYFDNPSSLVIGY